MRALLILLSAGALAGCETLAYYGQAAGGQLAVSAAARPVADVLADPRVPHALKARLRVAGELRDYATRVLALPESGAYRSYADLGRRYALWNVVAAPEFALEPVQSCFPVAGCVAYRGYYDREDAARHAAAQRAAGYDVLVYGVPAYSTLGWFDDPLLSTFIDYPDAELARLLFHELAHQVVYVKDDSSFNESFAVVVEREGVRRWLRETGRAAAPSGRAEFQALLAETRKTLLALYGSRLDPDEMRRRKGEALEALRPWLARMRGFESAEPSNAVLASFATYTEKVPGFERLLAEAGGDLGRFYARVRELAALPRAERDAQLR
ncbi:MAG: aminopeptidase [Betaproteobacteria bacterium]|nr:aminopeptidase [Betaproteobacteria bacterium]